MKMRRCVFFDKDGTLLKFDEMWVAAAEAAVKDVLCALGREDISAEELLAPIGVHEGHADITGVLCHGTYRMISNCFHEVLARHGVAMDEDGVFALTEKAFHDGVSAGRILPVCDDLPGVLNRLKARGCLLILVTSDDSVVTGTCLRALGLENLFDRVYTHEDGGAAKPDPYYINITLAEYGVERENAYMVGDTVSDMRFAQNAGVTGIGVAFTADDIRTLSGHTLSIVRDVSYVERVIFG